MSTADHAAWVDEAAKMPVAFAQVREDALIDLAVLERVGREDLSCFLIASGGCTAATLAASGRVSHLHLIDANAAQMVLARLKLDLLRDAEPAERLRLLGHTPMDAHDRAAELASGLKRRGASADALGPLGFVADVGPDHAGRYELVFAQLRGELRDVADELAGVLKMPDTATRVAATAPETRLGRRLDEAFDRAMALPHLVRLVSAQATQNAVMPFARHFAARARHAIATLATADNPYLWQMLLGRFPAGVVYPWLTARPPNRMPTLTETIGMADVALSGITDRFDFVHLSNVLDWLSPEEARRTLGLAFHALRRGGYVLIRQLNSTLDVRTSGGMFEWLADESEALHARDRSFFYRRLHLGRKR